MAKSNSNRNPGYQQQLANPQVLISASQGFNPVWSRPQVNNDDLNAVMSGLKSLETGLYQAARLSQGSQALKDKQLTTRRAQLEGAAGADGDAEGAIWASRFGSNTLDDPLSQIEIDAGEKPNANRDDLYRMINVFTDTGGRPEDGIQAWIESKIPANLTSFTEDMTPVERQTQLLELNAYRKKYEPAALAAGLKWYQEHYVGEIVETRGHYEAQFLAMAPVRSIKFAGPTQDGEELSSSGLETTGIRPGRGIAGYAKHLRGQDPHMAQMSNDQVAGIVLRGAKSAAFEHLDFDRARLLISAVQKSGLATEERSKLLLEVDRKEIDVNLKETYRGIGRLARSVAVVDPDDEAIASWAVAVEVAKGNSEHARRVTDSLKAMDGERVAANVSLHERRMMMNSLMLATRPNGKGGRERILLPGDDIYDRLSVYTQDMESQADAMQAKKKATREDRMRVMSNLTVQLMVGLDRASEDKPYFMELPATTPGGDPYTVKVKSVEELHSYILQTYPEDAGTFIDASMKKLTADQYEEISPLADARRVKYSGYEDKLKFDPDFQSHTARRTLLNDAMTDFNDGLISDVQHERIKSLAVEQRAYGGAMEHPDFKDAARGVEAAFMSAAGASPMTGGPVPTWMIAKEGDFRAKTASQKAKRSFAKDYRRWLASHKGEQFSKDPAIREAWKIKQETELDNLAEYHSSFAAWAGVDFAPPTAKARNTRGPQPVRTDFNLWTPKND